MRALVLLSVGLLIAAASGCMGFGGSTKSVSATDSQYTPNSLSLKQNDKVTWKNDGSMLHSVTIHKAGEGMGATKKDSDITKGSSTDYKFEETGTFHVYCKYHSSGSTNQFSTGMVMTVTVA